MVVYGYIEIVKWAGNNCMSESRINGSGEVKTKLGALKEFVAKGIVDTVAKK